MEYIVDSMHASIAPGTRETKYCKAIVGLLRQMGHATNTQLLHGLTGEFPGVSATTVHRATARLAKRGEISIAPPTLTGSMRYDANTTPHDHFMCSTCGVLKDADVATKVRSLLEAQLDDCHISGRLTISGMCKTCKGEEK